MQKVFCSFLLRNIRVANEGIAEGNWVFCLFKKGDIT